MQESLRSTSNVVWLHLADTGLVTDGSGDVWSHFPPAVPLMLSVTPLYLKDILHHSKDLVGNYGKILPNPLFCSN